jgi:hypothetical protein
MNPLKLVNPLTMITGARRSDRHRGRRGRVRGRGHRSHRQIGAATAHDLGTLWA